MSYTTLIKQLFQMNRWGGVKLGLQNVLQMQCLLDYPDRKFQSIHVAGTNGKGSVTTKIAQALQEAGYCVGLYTSPHLSSFRERIRVNGEMISEQEVERLLSSLFERVSRAQIPTTFFELTTFLAFLYFAERQIDVGVIEVGLGGRLDATNMIHPCLSVITSISLDHMETLGTTREAIAKEKGGIIKEHIPVIIGPHVPLTPIQEIVAQKQSVCLQVQQTSPLFEEENRLVAHEALKYLSLHFHLTSEQIEKGLRGRQPCRFEVVQESPPIILDVAHNPDGLEHLFRAIQFHYPNRKIRVLFGLSKNKDLHHCLKIIAAHGHFFHLVMATNGRGATIDTLQGVLEKLSVHPLRLLSHDSIRAGTLFAREETRREQEVLVICGSFFIMSEVRQALGFCDPSDCLDLNERFGDVHHGI
jgi:dihydrofolate synthase / folylpolyglutamate synthase